MTVEIRKSGLRTRSRYSRRATIAGVRQERVAAGHQAASSSADGRRLDRSVLVGRPADELDEDRLERRLGDLEPGDRDAPAERRGQDVARLGAGPTSSSSANPAPGRTAATPATAASQAGSDLALDPEADGPAPRWPA